MKQKITGILSGLLMFSLFVGTAWAEPAMQRLSEETAKAAVVAGQTTQQSQSIPELSSLLRMDELSGWAAMAGEGLEGVTGGGNASPQIVTTLEEFTELAGDDIPRVLIVSGKISCTSYGISIGSNKTIVGLDENATIYGGIRIHNKSNIIVSNIKFEGTWPNSGPDDCVEVKNSHHLWFNHLDVWNSTDGNMDITLGSDYVTVSWCKFWYSDDANDGTAPEQTHRLSNLIGSGTGHDDTDMGKLRVTYHHNWFAENLDQRMPRVMYGRAHIYNNYYSCQGNSYCIGADCYASILVENNYFDKVKNPHQFSYGTGFPSCITVRGNVYNKTSGKKDSGQGDEKGYAVPFEHAPYDYKLNTAKETPEVVKAYAGTVNMSDASTIPEKWKTASTVAGQEETIPQRDPVEEIEETSANDNPITYDAASKTYTYNGLNSDNTNAYYTLENPFAGRDYSETPLYVDGKPVWTKGATISYWVKVPSGVTDAPVLNFNLKERQVERGDLVKYNLCQNYSASDPTYSMGTQLTYVDEKGKEYQVLEGYGENVCANPSYPRAGYYYATDAGGAYRVYRKGTDSSQESNWTYLNYIGQGIYEEYGHRFEEAGGEKSQIKEADVKGSLSLYASGSMGYRQDNWTGIQKNPNSYSYGSVIGCHIYNQFYYWGNGGHYQLKNSTLKTPVMAEKGTWHFVVAVIQNDWIQYYMDGKKMSVDYLNWWGSAINSNTASDSFNLGYGQKMNYKGYVPAAIYQNGKTILDFISDEDTVLTIGGMGYGATVLGQNTITTGNGVQVKDVQFYFATVDEACIQKDSIDFTKGNMGPVAPVK